MKKAYVSVIILILAFLSGCYPSQSSEAASSLNGSSSITKGFVSKNETTKASASQTKGSTISNHKTNRSNHTSTSNYDGIFTPDFPINSNRTAKNFTASELNRVRFYSSNINQGLAADLPKLWKIKKSASDNSMYDIYDGSRKIGKFIYSKEWDANAKMDLINNDIRDSTFYQKRKYTYVNGKSSLTYCLFVFDNKQRVKPVFFRIEVDANEISEKSFKYIVNSASIYTDIVRFDSKLIKSNNSSSNVLILGNSFVASSQIGEIMRLMLNKSNKNVEVEAQSRGYYSVSLYTEDAVLMEKIESGMYDVVFLCGFYSHNDAAALSGFVSACKKSGTALVITPAHNESDVVIASATESNRDIPAADWRSFINDLIRSGLSYDYFCINDMHKHTTVIGGYAGASLLYWMLFEEKAPSVYDEVIRNYPEIYQYGLNGNSAADVFKQIENNANNELNANCPCYELNT